ncbi:DNA-directed DNA polymerase II small subunit [archaeon AH-315-M20]|nr:DNA-directed DNA polymerase II small subunit [archaeon AH-315-M20]
MQKVETKKKKMVDFFLKKGLLLSQDLLEQLENKNVFLEICKLIENNTHQEITVLNKKIKYLLNQSTTSNLNWSEIEKINAISEKKGNDYSKLFEPILGSEIHTKPIGKKIDTENNVKVIFSYKSKPKKRNAQDFVEYFNNRLQTTRNILKQRQELQNTISINRLLSKKGRDQVAVIGMVKDKHYTKNNNCMVTIEDETGYIKTIINKTKPNLFNIAKDIVLDEIIGIAGVNGENIIFVNKIFFPEIPLTKDIKKTKEEAYALFLSDIHVGSKNFLEGDFNRFLKWINQDLGNEEQRQTSSKVKYIFVLGDLVDGCGVYPEQDKELSIKDIKEQYQECANLLIQIPKNIKLIICPGNHDAMRVAEPQLPIYKDFSEPIYNLPNTIMVSNPSLVNIHSSDSFPGFDVLIYHGYSFDFYAADVESIRKKGGYDRADLIMKFLLRKRHLAPTHTSTLYVPDTNLDPLVINKVPDFFVSGHIHKAAAANYRNITLISGSCWQSKTSFQEKVGHNPEPSRVPIVNLQTRQIKILKFGN